MVEKHKKYRLVTRSDMDGLVCAILLKEMDLLNEIKFVHPKDVQDGKVDLNENDITTNLPYNKIVHLSFDHHSSEQLRIPGDKSNQILDSVAPSAARVVYNYFGGINKFTNISCEMMEAVDKSDSGQFMAADILYPKRWELLSFIMDARTGLGRFRNFRISNYDLMMSLIDYCRDHLIGEIIDHPDVKERVELYFRYQDKFKDQIRHCSTIFDNLVVLDLRNQETIFPGNRFMIYALHPRCNISIHVLWGVKKRNTVFAVGKSIFNRTSKINIGNLMLEYGGGGHTNAGTCQVDNNSSEEILDELISRITTEG